MQLQVKAQHATVPDSVHAYAEKRLSKLSRRLYEGTVVEVTFSREHNPSIRDDHVAEGVVFMKGPNLVAREAAPTYEAAVDRLVDKLERQIERNRDKRVLEPRRAAQRKREAGPGEEAAEAEDEAALDPRRSSIVARSAAAISGDSRSRRHRSRLRRVTTRMGVVATTLAVRRPPERIAISPNTSPGPSARMTAPSCSTSAVPSVIA